jgi:hypothetical protein
MTEGIEGQEMYWRGVTARSLAYLCLDAAELKNKDLAAKATFLLSLGLARKDVAALLQTTEETVRVTMNKARKARKRKSTVK